MNAFPIGLSALAAATRGLDLVGQNIANANTPGYHRQRLDFSSRTTDGFNGTGVEITGMTRYEAQAVRTAILRGNSDQADATTRLDIRRQVEATLGAGPGGIGGAFERFFNQVEGLTARPDDPAVRRPLIAAAGDLARQFTTAAADIDKLRADAGTEIRKVVNEVNDLTGRIADLNGRIQVVVQRGDQANDLMDQRDRLIDELSQRVDVRMIPQPYGAMNVMGTDTALVVGPFASQYSIGSDAAGNLTVTQQGSSRPATFSSGTLGGLVREYNTDLPATRSRLDGLARELMGRVNALHATGIGTDGPFSSLAGSTPVADPSAPLAGQNLWFPVQAGTLTVSVTDAAGNRTNTAIAFDPATDSLQDVAAAFGGIPGLTASVNATTGQLTLTAAAGYKFDFAGRDTNPAGGGAVADPDTTGLLTALGVNNLFTGTSAGDIAVRPDLLSNPNALAASRTGQPGDASNLERIALVRDQRVFSGRTLSGEFADLAAVVGVDVKGLDDQQTAQAAVLRNLNGQEQAVVGVDTNEELVQLLQYQRMVEGASKYLSAVNTALDSMLEIIR
ncbi:MAG: flagellar hook-associated protein FlgK [Gemmataceae bacterium]|nr:flagellar hook-associated protein FlgK [Gemmataceae bacterium]